MSDTAATEGRSPAVIAAVVIGALVVLGALWFLVVAPLLAGDADDDAEFDPRAGLPEVTATEPAVESTETPEELLAALPIETYEIFLSRDPFDPVIPAPATDGGAAAPDTDGDGVPDVVIVDGDGDGVPDGTDSDGDGVPDDDGGVEHNAVLIDVFIDDSGEPRALIRVDDRIFTVGEGDTFADGFTVVDISGTCATLSLRGETFTLCEGGAAAPGDGRDGDGVTDDAGPCRGDEEVVCDGRVVTLIDVFVAGDGTPVAVVQVDSTIYEVRRGETFAQNFQVISIDPPCVTLLFGDDAFTLCEGERTLK